MKSKENNAPKKRIIGNYSIEKTIGEGTFGKVKLGIHIPTQEKVAIKILEKDKIQDRDDLDRITREITLLKRLKHNNIIKIYEIVENSKNFFIIMEYAVGGELFNRIVEKKRLEEREASYFFCQILSGLEYIHQNRIVHRDLKPENLLLTSTQVLKISDFGLSNEYKQGQLLDTPCGSPCYAAPEMILGRKYQGLLVDIWSIGIILYAMVCGYLPFEDKNNNEKLYKKILSCKLEFPERVSPCCRDLIKKILTVNPSKRIKIDEIKAHPFLKLGRESFLKEEQFNSLSSSQIDESILEKMSSMGIDRTQAIFNIENNKHNNITTTYYLLFQKKRNTLINDDPSAFLNENGNNINISINTYNNAGNSNIYIHIADPKSKATAENVTERSKKEERRDCSVNVRINNEREGNKKLQKSKKKTERRVKETTVGGSKASNESGIEQVQDPDASMALDISNLIKKNKVDSTVIIGGAKLLTPVNPKIFNHFITANKEIDLSSVGQKPNQSTSTASQLKKAIDTSISYDHNPTHFDTIKVAEHLRSPNNSNTLTNFSYKKYIPSNTIDLMDNLNFKKRKRIFKITPKHHPLSTSQICYSEGDNNNCCKRSFSLSNNDPVTKRLETISKNHLLKEEAQNRPQVNKSWDQKNILENNFQQSKTINLVENSNELRITGQPAFHRSRAHNLNMAKLSALGSSMNTQMLQGNKKNEKGIVNVNVPMNNTIQSDKYYSLLTEDIANYHRPKQFPSSNRVKTLSQIAFRTGNRNSVEKYKNSSPTTIKKFVEKKPSERNQSNISKEINNIYTMKSPKAVKYALAIRPNIKNTVKKPLKTVDINISNNSSALQSAIKTQSHTSRNTSALKIRQNSIEGKEKTKPVSGVQVSTVKTATKVGRTAISGLTSNQCQGYKFSSERTKLMNIGVINPLQDKTRFQFQRSPGKYNPKKSKFLCDSQDSQIGGELSQSNSACDLAICTLRSSVDEIKKKLTTLCNENSFALIEKEGNIIHCKKDDNEICIKIISKTGGSNLMRLSHLSGHELVTKEMIKQIILNVAF